MRRQFADGQLIRESRIEERRIALRSTADHGATVDLTATGTTLRENDLVIMDEISSSTARLIANRGSYRLRHDEVSALVEAMQRNGNRFG